MKDRMVYILLAVFVLLGTAFFLSRQQWQKGEEAEKQSKRVMPVDSEDVLAIRLKNAQGDFDLVKDGDEWLLREPIATRADEGEISSLLSYLSSLSVERVLEEGVTERQKEDFGLLAPEVVVTVDATGATYDLRVGKDTLTPDRLYAMRSGNPRVLVVDRNLRDRLDKTLYDLRDKSVFSFNTGEAVRVAYVSPSRKVAAEKEGEKLWRLEQPAGARADESQVSSLLSRLRYIQAQAFVDEPTTEPTVYGLAQPATQVTVWSGPERSSETLLFGRDAASDARIYAMKEGSQTVFKLEKDFLRDIEGKVVELRDRRLASIESWDLQKVRIEAASSTIFAASRSEDRSWAGLPPVSGNLKRYETDDYLRDLADIEVDAFIDRVGPLADYRLDPPDYRVTLVSRDREEILRFGVLPPSATDELDVDEVYALRPDESSVFAVEPRVVSLLCRSFTELLEPAPTPTAASADITTLGEQESSDL